VRRIGSSKTASVNVRLIAATNRNTAAEVQRGNFREDLYFRVSAAHVVVPPLRDRMADLRMLVEHFLSRETPPRTIDDVPANVWDMFHAHKWPGNVRELRNAVQRLLITPERALRNVDTGAVRVPPAAVHAAMNEEVVPLRIARRDAGDAFERAYLERVLKRTGGNVTRAAAIAEVSRQMVQKLMRKHGLGSVTFWLGRRAGVSQPNRQVGSPGPLDLFGFDGEGDIEGKNLVLVFDRKLGRWASGAKLLGALVAGVEG
jgi:transcriptional regulator with GAF, ATPase, and Fis domain